MRHLHFKLSLHPERHIISVELALEKDALPSELRIASWTPGSYLMREYAQCIRSLEVCSAGRTASASIAGKASWTIPAGEDVRVRYDVFARQFGIHGAFLERSRGAFNAPAVFILPDGWEGTATVEIDAPEWQVFTSLERISLNVFRASSREELLDSPFHFLPASSSAEIITVEACGTPHEILITGGYPIDSRRIARDFTKIFESTIRFWSPEGKAPFRRYLLAMHLDAGAYGGLEHAAGTVLLEDPAHLPAPCDEKPPKGYDDVLSLVAHEYFHAWLVKRLRPAAFAAYDLSREIFTPDLWVFEGLTSYFESLIPLRAGVMTREAALKQFGRRASAALSREGFDKMTLAEASRLAWVKLYRPTEDSPYAQTSYYSKGALAGFILNDAICEATQNKKSLEDVLRGAWTDALRSPELALLPEDGFPEWVRRHAGVDLSRLLQELVHGRNNRGFWMKAFAEAAERRGLRLAPLEDEPAAARFAGLVFSDRRRLKLGYVRSTSPAGAAGLFAGDELVAVEGFRADAQTVDRLVAAHRGRTCRIDFFRQNRLISTELSVPEKPEDDEFAGFTLKPIQSIGASPDSSRS